MTPEEIIKLTNEYRKSQGLPPLKVNAALMKAAQARASNMASTGVFAHGLASTTMKDFGYDKYTLAGENLANNFSSVTSTMKAWQESATHNKNLLEPKFSEIGVAIVPAVYRGRQTNFIVQFFGNADQFVPAPVAAPVKPKAAAPVAGKTTEAVPEKKKFFFAPITMRNANSTIPMAPGREVTPRFK